MNVAPAPGRFAGLRLRLVATLIGCSLVWFVFADVKGPAIPKGQGEQCVADTDFMRTDHMRLLLHQRDETVIRGLRDEPFSLAECVDCHVQYDAKGEPLRVDGEGQFCQSCHAYAAVKIDCFGCHAAVPDKTASQQQPGDTALLDLSHPKQNALASLATFHYAKKPNYHDNN